MRTLRSHNLYHIHNNLERELLVIYQDPSLHIDHIHQTIQLHSSIFVLVFLFYLRSKNYKKFITDQVEQKRHELVLETLKDVDKSRKCFRLIGGVLVERTVNEVIPALEQNKDQITKLIESLQTQMISKSKEINEHREKYNIRFEDK